MEIGDNPIRELEKEQFIEEDGQKHEECDTKATDTWANRIEFVLALIGFTVGMGSVWRFPIICARNGGGAFIIPFVLLIVIIGGPLYFLEICLGQFTGHSPTTAFEFCPLLKGIGYLMVVMVTFIMWYYQTVMAWILYYFYKSFSTTLPWSTCTNWWNTPSCEANREQGNDSTQLNITSLNTTSVTSLRSSPAMEFWEDEEDILLFSLRYNVLRQSNSLEDLGDVQPHLSLALFLSWIIVQACLFRGVKSLGKVVYFTALFPYVLLTVLLIRGVTLDGADQGLVFFLKPDFSKLLEIQVWLDASLQVFYSLGPMWGGIITMASHNQFKQGIMRETVTVCFMNGFTALYAGLVVFSVLGFMAKQAGVPIQDLAVASGHGLAFVVYPTATSYMPLPQLWAVMFFFMMMLLILDTVFASTEVVIATVQDLLPTRLKKYKVLVNIVVGLALYATGNLFLTKGGIHLFQLMDWYVTAFAVLSGAFIESHMIANIYGADRLSLDIEMMTGKPLSRFMRLVICAIIPVFGIITFLAALVGHTAVTYPDGTTYKPYAIAIGVIVGLMPIKVMICVNLHQVVKAKGPLTERLYLLTFPSRKWKPKDEEARTLCKNQPYLYEETILGRLKKNIYGSADTPYF